jgi:hypothetical protein
MVHVLVVFKVFILFIFCFKARLQNFKKRLLALSRLPICPSICMEQLTAYWTDLDGI